MNDTTVKRPIQGPPDGKGSSDPAVRQAWLDFRAGGITATEVRDWGNAARRREIISGKITGNTEDLSHIPAVAHGNRREPIIAEWIGANYGIAPCETVYTSADNPRHLASPDGVTTDPFTGELVVDQPDAALAEIKTSKYDLTPGEVIDEILVHIDPESHFARMNYYTQIQWQMYVMQATKCLFVWEQHNNKVDPETNTFTPLGPPEAVWIMRDQQLIDVLIEQANKGLEEIDAARVLALTGELPPVSDLPSEQAALVADYLRALDAEKIATTAKTKAWAALQDLYLGDGKDDFTVDAGFARVTVSTSTRTTQKFDSEAARKRAPSLMQKYDALVKRYSKPVTVSNQRLTITTPKKAQA